jgi:hypothetical protein
MGLVLVSVPSTVMAKLLVLSPDKVLSASDAIVAGTVVSRAETSEALEVTIRVERVLKGTVKTRTIELSAGPYMPSGNPPDAFPEEGMRVFVALRGDGDGWVLASDLNAVGIMENGHVVGLYHGIKIGLDDESWEPGDYVSAYDQFYRSHMSWFERVSEWLRNLIG